MVSDAYFKPFPIAVVFATTISRFDDILHSTPTCVEKLYLSAVKLRLTRWGEAVGIYRPVALESSPNVDPEDIQEAKDVLVEIIALFDGRVSAHTRSSNGASSFSTSNNHPLDGAIEALHEMMEFISNHRSRGAPPPVTPTMVSARAQDPEATTSQEILANAASNLILALELCYPAAAERRRQCRYEMEVLGVHGPMVTELGEYAGWQYASLRSSDVSYSFFGAVLGGLGAAQCVCM